MTISYIFIIYGNVMLAITFGRKWIFLVMLTILILATARDLVHQSLHFLLRLPHTKKAIHVLLDYWHF